LNQIIQNNIDDYTGAGNKMSFMIFGGDDLNFVWETIQRMQLVFHPRYAPAGQFDYGQFSFLKNERELSVFLDRNLLSSLMKLCHQGFLQDELEMRTIALLMTWAIMNGIPVSAGMAIKENANKTDDSISAKTELQTFVDIFDFYPSMIWLHLAKGVIGKITPCPVSQKPFETEIAYHEKDEHLLMHIATMLHVVFLCRQKNLSPESKVMEFLSWNCKNLLIGQYTNTYIALLFTAQEGISAPKNVNSNDIEKIMTGCYNQAWDLNYLSNWSSLYWDEDKKKESFLFATNDRMLKSIFVNSHGNGNFLDLIEVVFPKKSAKRIIDFYCDQMGEKRIKPNFGENPRAYFYTLIEQEKQRVISLFS